MPHCVAFECSIQAKNRKKDPKIRFHKFPDDVAIRRAGIQAVGKDVVAQRSTSVFEALRRALLRRILPHGSKINGVK